MVSPHEASANDSLISVDAFQNSVPDANGNGDIEVVHTRWIEEYFRGNAGKFGDLAQNVHATSESFAKSSSKISVGAKLSNDIPELTMCGALCAKEPESAHHLQKLLM